MKPQLPYGQAVALAIFVLVPLTAFAQSTNIEDPLTAGSSYVDTVSSASLVPWEKVPVTLSPIMRRMESILAGGGPSLESEMTASDLLAKLQAYGMPVVLDETAIDDELEGETIVQLELPDYALGLRLELALAKHNACLQLYPDHAKIISLDSRDDPEYFVTLTYDISGLANWEDRIGLANTIRQSVDSDGWTQTGTGDQSMAFSIVGGRHLLTISAPWTGHIHVRQLLAQMTTLGNYNKLPGRIASRQTPSRNRTRLTSSTPVEMPRQTPHRTPFQFSQQNGSAMGGGLGGGAFSAPGG